MAVEREDTKIDSEDLLLEAEQFVKVWKLQGKANESVSELTPSAFIIQDKFKDHDPSHDWHHVQRVRLMALNLSRCPSLEEERSIDRTVLELAA
jgi:hypothetical protein